MNEYQLMAIAAFTRHHYKVWSGAYDTEDSAWTSDLTAHYDNELSSSGVKLILELQHHKCFCFIVGNWIVPITDCVWAFDDQN